MQDFQLRTPPLARFAFPAIGAMGETNWTAILNAVCVLTADTQAGNTLQPSATEKDIAAASGAAVYWRRAFANGQPGTLMTLDLAHAPSPRKENASNSRKSPEA